MPRKFPPLTPTQVRAILTACDFTLRETEGSHEQWEHDDFKGQARLVTVDGSHDVFSQNLMHSMLSQSGMTRDEFYGQTRSTAKKIGLRFRRAATPAVEPAESAEAAAVVEP